MLESGLGNLKKPATAEELLRRPEASYGAVAAVAGLEQVDPIVAEQVEVDIKYAGYIERAERRAANARKLEHLSLPSDLDWSKVQALSSEVRERISKARPATLGQLGRLPGITPAAVNVVAALIAKSA